MSSVLTGCYPNKHTVRDPYCTIQRPTIAEILKGNGYLTAGFSGNGVLGSAHGFGKGFASYDEPDDREGHHFDTWQPDATREVFYGGNWWVDRFHEWMGAHHGERPFFVWGHLYHTHRGGEVPLLAVGQAEKAGQPLDVLLRREARPLRRRSHRPHDGQPEELGHVGGHHARLLQRPRHQPRRPSGRAAVLPPARAGLPLPPQPLRHQRPGRLRHQGPRPAEGPARPGPGALGRHRPHDPRPRGHPGRHVRHGRFQPGAGGEGRPGQRPASPTRRTCRSGRPRRTRCGRACAPRSSTSCATSTTAPRSGTSRPRTPGSARTSSTRSRCTTGRSSWSCAG